MLGVGLYMFPRKILEHYRNAVVHPGISNPRS